jgi:hypothetical protein
MVISADAPAPRIQWLRFTLEMLEERSVADVAELRPARSARRRPEGDTNP